MSIRVRVLLHADFREIVGKREIVEEVSSESTLKHVLNKLADRYGKDFKQIIDSETGAVSFDFLVSINGRITRETNVRLKSNDILIITIPAGGG